MKVLLIYPRFGYPSKAALTAPLGILYIAAVLRREGHEVSFLDLTFKETLPGLEGHLQGIDFVGVSVSSAMAGRAVEVAQAIRRLSPSLPLIAGGPHATVKPEHLLKAGFDAAVIGEGEETIVDLLKAFLGEKPLDTVQGIAFMKEGKLTVTEPRPFIGDLDSILEPARDLVDWQAYYGKSTAFDGMIASRGCPHRCIFCKPMQDRLFGRRVRYRSPGAILDEMAGYRELWKAHSPLALQGIPFLVMFLDDMFLSSPSWVDGFMTEVERRGERFWWGCQARVDAVDEERFRRMKEAGCLMVAFGVESGSPSVLEFLKKGITVDETRRAFEICRRLGINTHAYVIIGSPEETRDDLKATVSLIKEIQPTTCYVARATPIPGSYLHEYAEERGIINRGCRDEHYDYYYTRLPMKLTHLGEKDLDECERALNALFPSPVELRRQ
ncbi:MAG: radical SAM protein [Candidatus Eremiobacteraeota bacterium]|nr:radical SAM protein [Candidatus Eremiobacteraeota bacterium]